MAADLGWEEILPEIPERQSLAEAPDVSLEKLHVIDADRTPGTYILSYDDRSDSVLPHCARCGGIIGQDDCQVAQANYAAAPARQRN